MSVRLFYPDELLNIAAFVHQPHYGVREAERMAESVATVSAANVRAFQVCYEDRHMDAAIGLPVTKDQVMAGIVGPGRRLDTLTVMRDAAMLRYNIDEAEPTQGELDALVAILDRVMHTACDISEGKSCKPLRGLHLVTEDTP